MVFKRLFHKQGPAEDLARVRQSIMGLSYISGLEALPFYIREHPELLTSTALAELDRGIQAARAENRQDFVDSLEMYKYLFWRCQVVGLEQAYGELQSPSQYYPPQLKAIVRETEEMQPSDYLRGISLCETGLSMVDRERYPFAWVWLHYILGLCYLAFPRDPDGIKHELALEALQTALSSCSRIWYSYTWACIQGLLGTAYVDRNKGIRAENMQLAIQASDEALKVFELHGASRESARSYAVKGFAYLQLGQEKPAEYIEQAVRWLEAALRGKEFDGNIDQGRTQLNLSSAYLRRLQGDTADNVERAIGACEAALSVFTPESTPELWAMAQNNLGIAYRNRIHGNHAENTERAIQAYEAAISVISASENARMWGETQNHLGVAYLYRAAGELVENVEQALGALQSALSVCIRENDPAQWALIQNNLGLCFHYRVKGDRAENQEAAISAFQSALTVYSKYFLPDKWAMTQNNLGIVYRDRMHGNAVENLQSAIQAYRAALEVYTRKDFPADWAMTQMDLGVAYATGYQTDEEYREENLAEALTAYQAALNVYTRQDYPERWAALQLNLGNLYAAALYDSEGKYAEQAIQAIEAALSIYDAESYPEQRLRGYLGLGNAYLSRVQGSLPENLEKAAQALRSALEQAQTIGLQTDVVAAATALGLLNHMRGRPEEALPYLETAFAVLEKVRFAYFTEETKLLLARKHQSFHELMVDTCLSLGKASRALEVAEASKSRVFLDQLGYDALPSPPIQAMQQPLLDQESQALSEARALLQSMRLPADRTYRISQVSRLEQTRSTLESLWDQMCPFAPEYVALRRGDPITSEEAQRMAVNLGCTAAFLDFYSTPTETVVFILRADSREVVPVRIPVTQSGSQLELDNYRREVSGYGIHGDIGQRWQSLSSKLLGNTISYLEDAELIYLTLHGFLHQLPMHAGLLGSRYLIDYAPVVYAPSLAVLKRVVERKNAQLRVKRQPNALVIGYTPHENEREVFEGEAYKVAEQLNTHAICGKAATVAMLRKAIEPCDTLHLSCHGFFNASDPMSSGLVLADGVFTARDIMSMELKIDLVTLSACQTGLSTPLAGDELMGLTRALLYAGVSSVLVTLWSVEAQSTLEFMNDFYSRLIRGKTTKAAALQQTMLHIRAQRPHPYFWAPFILVGNWR